MRHRFVWGMYCQSMQKRLLSEKGLALEKATSIAVLVETVERDVLELQQKSAESGLHKISMTE